MSDPLSSDLEALRIRRDEPAPGLPGWAKAVVWSVVVVGAAVAAWKVALPVVEANVFKTEVAVTEIERVSPMQAAIDLTATGYVTPERFAKVAPKVLGRVVKRHVRENDRVKAGQVMLELDAADQRAAIASAQAKVKAAEARAIAARASMAEVKQQYDREKSLADRGTIATAPVDDLAAKLHSLDEQAKVSDAEIAAAKAEVAAFGVGLQNLVIPAPIDGTIVGKPPEVGDVVTPTSDGILEVVDLSSLIVETDVPEARLGQVKAGAPCEIVLDAYPDRRMRGAVHEISPRVNRSKATVVVKVAFVDASDGVLPDMAARVSFLQKALDAAAMKEAPKTVVPASAIVDRGGAKVVFAIEGAKVRMLPVTLGAPLGDGFELKDGPAPGTRIVKNPPPTLGDGQPVKEKEG